MPRDITLITVSDLVRRGAQIVDPAGKNPAVAELVARRLDDDQPVRGVLDRLEEHLLFGADDDPQVIAAQAIVLYLAHRLDELGDDGETILRLALRAEFHSELPPAVALWLREIEITW